MSDQQSQDEPSMEEILASIRRIISEDDPEEGQGDSKKADKPESAAQEEAAASSEQEGDESLQEDQVADESDEDDDELELTQKLNPDGSIDDLSAGMQEAAEELDESGFPKPTPIFDESEPESASDDAHPAEEARLEDIPAEEAASVSDEGFGVDHQDDAETLEETPDIMLEPEEPDLDDDDMDDIETDGDDSLLSEPTQAAASSALSEIARAAISQRALAIGDGRTLEDLVREALRPELKLWLDTHLASMVERIVREEIKKMVRRVENQ